MRAAGYTAPDSLSDAIAVLAGTPSARVLAGGSALLVGPSRAQAAASLLVDLRKIPGLASVEPSDRGTTIGAMTTLRAMTSNEAVRRQYPALVEAALLTGDAQMRNRATVGGSLAAASGDADIAAVLIALGATVEITGSTGKRSVAVEDLLSGSPARDEVLTSVTIPAAGAAASVAYQTQRNPATLTPLVGVAASVTLASNGSIAAVRIGLVGATAKATRLTGVEQALQGQTPSADAVKAAVAAAADGLDVRGDLFGSTRYRTHLVRVLTARAVISAATSARA
jgi:carbon-monoxide dehydrogenase medium subunit